MISTTTAAATMRIHQGKLLPVLSGTSAGVPFFACAWDR